MSRVAVETCQRRLLTSSAAGSSEILIANALYNPSLRHTEQNMQRQASLLIEHDGVRHSLTYRTTLNKKSRMSPPHFATMNILLDVLSQLVITVRNSNLDRRGRHRSA
jgi:hypothetical protein